MGPDEDLPAPAGLTPAQRKAWRELAKPLQVGGILDHVDMGLLEAAAIQLERARAARTIVNKEGMIYAGPHGRIAHPMLGAERAAWAEFRMIADRMGIGPSARARLAVGKSAAENLGDELDRTLGQPARLHAVSD